MKIASQSIVLLAISTMMPLPAVADKTCKSKFIAKSSDTDEHYHLKLLPPLSVSGGDLLFEYWIGGEKQWEASAEYGCSNGSVQCYLGLPYFIGSDVQNDLEIEMTFFTDKSDTRHILFSHLPQKLYNAYRWQQLGNDETNKPLSFTGSSTDEAIDFQIIPDVFHQMDCSE